MTRYVFPLLLIVCGVVAIVLYAGRPASEPVVGPDRVVTLEEGEGGPLVEPGRGDSGLLPAPLGQLEVYEAVERSGEVVSTGDLFGRFAVVDFIFTSCGGTCPRMTQAMVELQERLAGADDVTLVSFTVDPRRDTPEVLRAYADRYGADPERWKFLRMGQSFVRSITNDQLKIGDGGDALLHKSTFVLLDREGRGRAHYQPLSDPGWLDKLTQDLEALRAEPADRDS